ncbi:MAG: hypothetical protein EHM89_00330 [Acidobacteria bacterium]|nr:MAG: hypothetical protein EHM89_00330 [Acidobacteriota bacterium]
MKASPQWVVPIGALNDGAVVQVVDDYVVLDFNVRYMTSLEAEQLARALQSAARDAAKGKR